MIAFISNVFLPSNYFLTDGVFHVRHVLEHNKGNPGLRKCSMELCSRG